MGFGCPFMNWLSRFCLPITKYCITSVWPAGQEKLSAFGGGGGDEAGRAPVPQLQSNQQRARIEIEMSAGRAMVSLFAMRSGVERVSPKKDDSRRGLFFVARAQNALPSLTPLASAGLRLREHFSGKPERRTWHA